MPYSGKNDTGLPKNVIAMPEEKRSQWVEIFNSCIARGDDEATAFRKANGSMQKTVYAKIKALFGIETSEPSMFFKADINGQLRFFTTFSNCFKDAHSEIISSTAHEEYTDWVNNTGKYPQLWLWHAGPKSKWGQVDFIDFVDGFVVASGTVDSDKVHIAKALEKEDVKVSHGFYGLMTKDNTFFRYRTFEISPLPSKMAANAWTDFYIGGKEMPFSESRKQWLKEKANLSDVQIAEWEGSLATLSENLKSAGLEWKGTDLDEIIGVTKGLNDVLTQVAELKIKQTELDTIILGFKTELLAFDTKVTAATKTLEDKVAEAFTPVITPVVTGFKASDATTNVVEGAKEKEDLSWFEDIVSSVLR